MTNEDGTLNDCGVWTYDINTIPDLLANVIGAWMQDNIPAQLTDAMSIANEKYTPDKWNDNVDNIITEIVDEQIKSFESIKSSIQKNITNENSIAE